MMQTFLPHPDFVKSAKCLDGKRLGKQRVEVLQILKALNDPNYGWQNHPAVKMWRGYQDSLIEYGMEICEEWINRGFKDTCFLKIAAFEDYAKPFILPTWFGNEEFHSAHRAALLAKNYEWYSQFGWTEKPEINYVWPSKEK